MRLCEVPHASYNLIMNYRSLQDVSEELRNLTHTGQPHLAIMLGLSGAGKSYLSKKLSSALPNLVVISFDWWIKDPSPKRRAAIADEYEKSGEMPNPLSWYDWAAFKADIKTLQETGKLHKTGAWNQETGEKDLYISITLPTDGIILVEGMYLMEAEINPLVDYVIIVLTDAEKAIAASSSRRAHNSEALYRAVKARWIREYDAPYLQRYLEQADAVIDNTR